MVPMNTIQKNRGKWILTSLVLAVGATALWLVLSQPLALDKSPNVLHNPSAADPLMVSSSADPGPSQDTTPSTSSGIPERKFRDISASERRAILRTLQKDELPALLQKFLNAGRIENDPIKQSMIHTLFVRVLKEKGASAEFTEEMRKFVNDEKNSTLERGYIVGAYASMGTKAGAEFVLWVATTHPNQEVRDGARDKIDNLHCGEDRTLMVSMIEPLWRDSNDPKMIRAVAFGMARQAAPSGIQLLLLAASAPNYQDEVRRITAVEALAETFWKTAVPPLEAALQAEPLGSRMHTMAFRTLHQIGDVSAAKAIISWIQTADSSAADLAKKWVIHARGETHIEAAKAALSSNVQFRAEQNREAIRAGLKVFESNYPK